jgi:hypothetical protein
MGGAHRPSPVDLPRPVHRRRRSRDRLRRLSSHTGTDRVRVAELAGSVVGLTGVFEPGRTSRRNRSSLPAGAVRKSASSSSEESFRKPHHAVTNTSPFGSRRRATSAPSASATTRLPDAARVPAPTRRPAPAGRDRQALMDETAPRRIGCSASFELCRFTARAMLHTRQGGSRLYTSYLEGSTIAVTGSVCRSVHNHADTQWLFDNSG